MDKQKTSFTFNVLLSIFYTVFLSSLLCLPLAAGASEAEEPTTVFTSILPMVDIIKQIGGKRVRVFPLVLPGQSPETYSPTPKQMAALSKAKLYFRIGVPFERILLTKLNHNKAQCTLVDLRSGLDLQRNRTKNQDPHIWLDPSLVSKMTLTISKALGAIDPDGATGFENRRTTLLTRLSQLDQQLRTLLRPFADQKLYVIHPAYAYFCHAYQLQQRPIAPDGKAPGSRTLVHLIAEIRHNQVQTIFTQPQFSRKTAQAIAKATGAQLVPLDPLPADYFNDMSAMGKSIAQALNKKEVP